MDRDLVYVKDDGGGGVSVVFDEPGRPVNVLRREVWDALSRALDEVEAMDPPPARVLVRSGKPGTFIAGADLKVIRDAPDEELDAVMKQGQVVLDRLAGLALPRVALVGGAALGGGLEVALACDARVVASGDRPVVGLPEIGLGLVPGWGGTVRLVDRAGVSGALPWLLSGKMMTPAEALALGVADAVVPAEEMEAVGRSIEPTPGKGIVDGESALESARAGLDTVEPIRRRAAEAMLETVAARLRGGVQAGLDAERINLVALRSTDEGKELIRRFFDRKKK